MRGANGPDITVLSAAIGSVIPSADREDQPVNGATVWSAWTADGEDSRLYQAARAALAALLVARGIKRLWMPAYSCRVLVDGAFEARVEPVWYGVDAQLNADVDAIFAGIAPDDAVLAIAWFGRPPDAAFQTLANTCPGNLIIEDRAQALDPRGGIEGAIRLYSPRKLLGVGDGGLLVGSNLPPQPVEPARPDLWGPNDNRRADADGRDPASWFPAYQAREAAFDARPRRASDRTAAALARIGFDREAEARRRNWRALAIPLADVALWPVSAPDFAPLAFPVIVSDAADLVAYLASQRIWAARHWADLASPAQYREAHELSRRCVSLPLDGRYDQEDMVRVADAVRAFAAAGASDGPLQAAGAR